MESIHSRASVGIHCTTSHDVARPKRGFGTIPPRGSRAATGGGHSAPTQARSGTAGRASAPTSTDALARVARVPPATIADVTRCPNHRTENAGRAATRGHRTTDAPAPAQAGRPACAVRGWTPLRKMQPRPPPCTSPPCSARFARPPPPSARVHEGVQPTVVGITAPRAVASPDRDTRPVTLEPMPAMHLPSLLRTEMAAIVARPLEGRGGTRRHPASTKPHRVGPGGVTSAPPVPPGRRYPTPQDARRGAPRPTTPAWIRTTSSHPSLSASGAPT
jgi:hypothetical protein